MNAVDPDVQGAPLIAFSDHLPTIKFATQLLVNEAMERAAGNQSIAAKFLGISQQALSKRLKKINDDDPIKTP